MSSPARILTNSAYTKERIKATWDVDSKVIYPPCPQYGFSITKHSKKDTVCCIGRFTPVKGYERIFEVAKKLPHTEFHLVGGVTSDKLPYLERLKRMAPHNIKFVVNATIDKKKEILSQSKVLLHGFTGEHFGIGLVEAMSAGVIPVCHNSGAGEGRQSG